jgi:hypothetical protein
MRFIGGETRRLRRSVGVRDALRSMHQAGFDTAKRGDEQKQSRQKHIEAHLAPCKAFIAQVREYIAAAQHHWPRFFHL